MKRWLGCAALLSLASISIAAPLEPITVDTNAVVPTPISPVPTPGHPISLPTRYFADRFIVEPVTPAGQTLSFFTDSGGGLFILADAVERLGLTPTEADSPQGQYQTITLPQFLPDRFIPPPLFQNTGGKIEVEASGAPKIPEMGDVDGMLGTPWFGGRVWTFDYPNRRLLWRADGDTPLTNSSHTIRLGFQSGAAYPRIVSIIDGEPVELLFDTGATSILTDDAVARIGDGRPANRATCFIDESVFNRWTTRHPEWRVIKGAEKWGEQESIIEVPQITVAGYTVGPVWFTRRKDTDFQWMSSYMDRHIDGSLGGDALRNFRITVDYPNQTAFFER